MLPLQNNSSQMGAIIPIRRKEDGLRGYEFSAEPKKRVSKKEAITINGKKINMSEKFITGFLEK